MREARCPVCEAVNKGLNLEETNGRYICIGCNRENIVSEYKEADRECRTGTQNRHGGVVAVAERY